jgi:3-oxoacyl-[acyl-carrier protein] reductase
MHSLSGKSALVCGGSKGIGLASAIELARMGAQVTLLSRSQDSLSSALKELPGNGHSTISVDLSDLASLKAKLNGLAREIHILVCNSGGPKSGPITAARPEDFMNALSEHLIANHILVTHFLKDMKKARFGRIINILSTSVKAPLPNLGVSNTVRAAVAAWAKTLANEVGVYGITVNNVLPGLTDTDRIKTLLEATAKIESKGPEEVLRNWKDAVPLKRIAEPKEVGQVVAFLASHESSYISGINLPVDGGRLPTL